MPADKPTQAGPKEVPDLAAKMAAEVDLDGTQPPDGAPTLIPASALTRRKRAQFFKGIENLPTNAAGEIDLEGQSIAGISSMMTVFADIEDSLRQIAIDKQAFSEWADSCADRDLMQLFFWVFREMKLGEAGASQIS